MKISLFNKFGAQNSQPVFQAFAQGMQKFGNTIVEHDLSADVAVIWSMLWSSRMKNNQSVYHMFRTAGKPVVVLEVGCLDRGSTWKVGINGLSRGCYEWSKQVKRPVFGISFKDYAIGDQIMICSQNPNSEQWRGQPNMDIWIEQTINAIRCHSDRQIIVRSHPRYPVKLRKNYVGVKLDQPNFQSYDLEFLHSLNSIRAVINHNSNPGIVAALSGLPVIVDHTSLAWPITQQFENIENPKQIDRTHWYESIRQTEYTCEELAQGLEPLHNYLAPML